jgi:hypothetical protein
MNYELALARLTLNFEIHICGTKIISSDAQKIFFVEFFWSPSLGYEHGPNVCYFYS